MPLIWRTNFVNPYGRNYTPVTKMGETLLDTIRQDRELYDRFIEGRPQAN